MVLKELEIQGFKSFPDKIRITIGQGVTGVVGPNGSGKSNISDAIRWVLGETSSKQLRGAGKMEDVIFGGTQLRGAMGFASVRLTLDNQDRTLDVDADEVTVGRRYYRSGESEYSLNGQNCRLRDIYELFLDTGLGRDGYSIIGQGRIAEIVGAKSAERREIFEEASGIAKYRYRKNEAERRLANTEDNLSRLRDILGELESRLEPLARDSAKAERFLELAARRKSLEVTLWVDSVRRALEQVRELQHRYEAAQADYRAADEQSTAADQEAEAIRVQAQQLTASIEKLNGEIRTITEALGATDTRIAVLRNDMQRNQQQIDQLEQEIVLGEESRENVSGEIDQRKEAIAASQKQIAALDQALAALSAQLDELQRQSDETDSRRGQAAAELAKLTGQQTNARVAAAAAQSAADSARQQLSGSLVSAQAASDLLKKLERERADTAAYLSELNTNLSRLNNIKNGLILKRNARQKALDEADAEELRIDRELEAAEQRLSVLRELEKNMEGYQQSVKAVMHAAQSRRLRGIIGPVSGVLTVEKGCETAVETALGAAMQNIVTENEAAAKAAIALLRDTRAGRATFLPLDTVQPGVFRGPLPKGARLASELVRYDTRYENIVSNLLGRIVVVQDLNAASAAAKALNYRNRVVTMDGQVINAGGSFTGGSVQRSAGLFTRRQEIEELNEKLKSLQAKQDAAQAATDRCKAQVDAIAADLTATEGEIITANGDKIRAETELGRIDTALSQSRAAVEGRAEEARRLNATIAASERDAAQAAEQLAALSAQIDRLTGELAALTQGSDSFLQNRGRLADEMSQRRLRRLELEKDIEAQRVAIHGLQARIDEAAGHKAEVERSINALRQANTQCAAQITQVENERTRGQARIKEAEKAIADATNQRLRHQQAEGEANRRARAAADTRERMGGEMARLAERRTAAEADYDQTLARLWDDYQLSLSEAEKLCQPFETLTALRALVAEVRGKIRALGNVNVGAIDEYKEVKERYNALHTQVDDVERSKAELTRMIAELAGQMRQIFSENFAAINGHFGRIFAELFGGGTASLSLEDESDVLTSGIEIHVAPPGKVIKNLAALSGGEQALVAISIYFAILAVNPAPFCILDEIEAALDDANVVRFAQYLRRISNKTQFIVITHRRGTMEAVDILYGVTMQDDGVSKLLRLDLENVDASLVS